MGHSEAHGEDDFHPHITPFSTLAKVLGILLTLTFITVVAAKWQVFHFKYEIINTAIAMAIATVKATIVMLWFMHMKYESNFNRLVFASGFIFLFLLFFVCIGDIFTRINFQGEVMYDSSKAIFDTKK